MKKFFIKIKNLIKKSFPTVLLFIITFIITLPVSAGLAFAVMMSTDSGTNTLSVYILRDLLSLLFSSLFLPLFSLVIYGHFVPIIIIIISKLKKSKKFSIKLYIALLIMQSLPFSTMFFSLHSNFEVDYKEERILEIKRDKGEMVEGTLMYELSSRYLNLNNIDDIRNMAKQDELILSYEYKYISNYLDYVDYLTEEDALKKVLKIYNQDFPEDRHYISFNRFTSLYLDMIKEFKNSDISVDDVHSKIKRFMNKNMSYNPHDGRTIDDDLSYSLDMILAYENIRIKERISKGFPDIESEKIVLEAMLQEALHRVTEFIEGNSYDYQYGENKQIKDASTYIEYCKTLRNLIDSNNLTSSKVLEDINYFSKRQYIDLTNENLITLQVLFQY